MEPQDPMATPGPQDAGAMHNPYAAPTAEVSELIDVGLVKAGRVQRLLATLIDSMVIVIPTIMAIALPAYQGYVKQARGETAGDGAMPMTFAVILGILMLAYIGYQLYWLWKNGQTLGKKVMKIKIVRTDGSRASFPRLLFLRALVPGIVGYIPALGPVLALTDWLFIFGEPKRCVHDYLADTIVINT